MININLFKYVVIALMYFFFLVLDGVMGTHTLSTGFLLSLAFFITKQQLFMVTVLFSPFHDVRFLLPLGLTAVLLIPYLFVFEYGIKIFRSRMIFLYGYVSLVSIVLSLAEFQHLIEPNIVLADLLVGLIGITVVYFFAIRKMKDFSFSTKSSALKF